MPPAPRSAVKSVIAGNRPVGSLGFEGQGNWADFRGDNISLLFQGTALVPVTVTSRGSSLSVLSLVRWVTIRNSVLFYVSGAAVVGDKFNIYAAPGTPGAGTLLASGRNTRWGGTVGAGLEFGFARTGQSASSMITSSSAIRPEASRLPWPCVPDRPDPPRCRYWLGALELIALAVRSLRGTEQHHSRYKGRLFEPAFCFWRLE